MRSPGLKSGAFVVLMTLAMGIEAPSSAVAQDAPAPRTARLLERGAYGTGTATIGLVDYTRNTQANGKTPESPTRSLPTKVWYPAKDDALVDVASALPGKAKDGFPLIVYGHGLGSNEEDIAHVASHLASHGYVVASVRFPLSNNTLTNPGGATVIDVANQPVDLLYVSKAIVSAPIQGLFPFAKQIDATRTGLMGYSLGGVSAALAANYPGITAVATLAPAACGLYLPGGPGLTITKPLLVMGGETDAVTPLALNGDLLFGAAFSGPKYLVHIANGSHGGFVSQAPTLERTFPHVPMDALICSQVAASTGPTGPACNVCKPGSITGPQLPAVRHHALAKAAILSFFDGYLRDERRDQQFLKNGLEQENPELAVTYEGPANQ